MALLTALGLGVFAAACTSTPSQPAGSGHHATATSSTTSASSSPGASTGTTKPPGAAVSLPDPADAGGSSVDTLVLRASGRGSRDLGNVPLTSSDVHVQFWCDGPGRFTVLANLPEIDSTLLTCLGTGTAVFFGYTVPSRMLRSLTVQVDPTTRWSLVVTEGP